MIAVSDLVCRMGPLSPCNSFSDFWDLSQPISGLSWPSHWRNHMLCPLWSNQGNKHALFMNYPVRNGWNPAVSIADSDIDLGYLLAVSHLASVNHPPTLQEPQVLFIMLNSLVPLIYVIGWWLFLGRVSAIPAKVELKSLTGASHLAACL